jgi:hypothetical protein
MHVTALMFGALHNGPQGAVMPILMVALIALGAFGLIGLMLTLAVTLEQRKANEKQPGSGKVS